MLGFTTFNKIECKEKYIDEALGFYFLDKIGPTSGAAELDPEILFQLLSLQLG